MASERGAAWQPILAGELGARAERVVLELAEALAEPGFISPVSLAGGAPGLALFFAYLGRSRPGEGHEERASRLLDQAIDAVGAAPVDASLYGGFTGVAWTAEHLAASHLVGDDDANEGIDEALLDLLAQSPWREDHDLVSGLAGLAVYALERRRRPSGRQCLELILDRLEETAERQAGRATWKTRPELIEELTRRDHPDGYYNVGAAHGVPGVVAILAPMAAAGIGDGRAWQLLGEAIAWVLDQRRAEALAGTGSVFPYFVGPAIAARPARFAWCYGDPGVAASLLAAARAVGDEPLERAALGLSRRSADQPATRADVVDAGLCHGAAGLAHLFNRIYQSSGDAACAAAARRWFARALEMRRPGEGLAGFLSWAGAEGGWRSDAGLLTGAAGIALALLGAISSIEPAWDRLLLASSAPA